MTTALQVLASSTHFKNEGLYWLKKAIETRRKGDAKAEALARKRLARVTLQLRTVRRRIDEATHS